MEHEHPDVQFILDSLCGTLVVGIAEGDLLLALRDAKWAKESPKTQYWQRCVKQERTFSHGTKLDLGTFGIKHLKRHQRKIPFDCELIVNPGFTSAQLLSTIQHHVSSTLDDLGQECVLGTHPPPQQLHDDNERVGGG